MPDPGHLRIHLDLRGKPADQSKAVVYVDESGTPNLAADDCFMVGALICPGQVPHGFFDAAIDQLESDPDSNADDEMTVRRGYFHASSDSKNAHSHCCRRCTELPWPSSFAVEVLDKSGAKAGLSVPEQTERKLHQHVLALVMSRFYNSRLDSVELLIASRHGSLGGASLQRWCDAYLEGALWSLMQTPLLPLAVPKLSVVAVDADEDGIQACDFLLWSVQRSVVSGDGVWLDRTCLHQNTELKLSDPPLEAYSYSTAGQVFYPEVLPLTLIKPLDELEKRLSEKDYFYKSLVNVERQVRAVNKHRDIPLFGPLRSRVARLCERIDQQDMSPTDIVELASVYLLLADSVPLYDVKSAEEVAHVCACKILCSRAANTHQVTWLSMCDHWLKFRINVEEKQPNLLDQ